MRVSWTRLLAQYGDDRVDEAVALYRVRYSESGLYDCTVYPGVTGMLDALRDRFPSE